MNVLALAAYALTAALILGLSGWLLERALTTLRQPARWVWLGTLGVSVWLPIASMLSHAEQRVGFEVIDEVQVVELAQMGPVEDRTTSERGVPGAFGLLDEWRSDVNRKLASAAVLLPQADLPLAWIAGLWSASSISVAMILFASMLRLSRRARRWPVAQLLGRQVKISPDMGPATVGFSRPSIVIPRWARELPSDELELVLCHEVEHVRARDTLLLAVALLAVIACPWNPLVWWQLHRLKAAVEVDCDRRILHRGVAPARYGALLVRLGTRGHLGQLASPALAGSTSLLERRLTLMKNLRSRNSVLSSLIAMGAALVLVGVACTSEVPVGVNSDAASEAAPAPNIAATSTRAADPVIPIWISRNGAVEVSNVAQPIDRVAATLKTRFPKEAVVSIEAHQAAPYRVVAALQDQLRAAGFLRVVFTRVDSNAQRPPPRELAALLDAGLAMVLPGLGPQPLQGRVDDSIVVAEAAAPRANEIPSRNLLFLEALPTGTVLVTRGDDSRTEEVGSQDVEAVVRRALAQNGNTVAVVKTQPNAEYRHMYEVLAAIRRAGATRYSLQLAS